MIESTVHPWQEVTPLPQLNGSVDPILATVDALRTAWEDFIAHVSAEEFAEARQRSLRRHAIETGIIERLYDVDWGVTEALVAEGLTREVAEREGGIDEDALETITAQFDALSFLADAEQRGQPLTPFFIRQLHQLITTTQSTYDATDALGQAVDAPLHRGQWKTQPNHVRRPDGTLLEYTPPEHVQSEIDRLTELFEASSDAHPIVRAAWLHHRFICIHPFKDGNGRVARALVLLVLLAANYSPLVVDRTRRDEYLRTLDAANDGDLLPLIRLFAQLEIVALRSELEVPAPSPRVGQTAVDVAESVVERLRGVKLGTDEARAAAVASVAESVRARVESELSEQAARLKGAFLQLDPKANAWTASAKPPDKRAKYWRIQLIDAARAVSFFTNLNDGTWWVQLSVSALGVELRYVVATQKVGHGETGVVAVTVFAESVVPRAPEADWEPPAALIRPTSADSVTLTEKDSVDDRWAEICEVIERTLAAAVAEFGKLLA